MIFRVLGTRWEPGVVTGLPWDARVVGLFPQAASGGFTCIPKNFTCVLMWGLFQGAAFKLCCVLSAATPLKKIKGWQRKPKKLLKPFLRHFKNWPFQTLVSSSWITYIGFKLFLSQTQHPWSRLTLAVPAVHHQRTEGKLCSLLCLSQIPWVLLTVGSGKLPWLTQDSGAQGCAMLIAIIHICSVKYPL